jgi:GxxExxY protein
MEENVVSNRIIGCAIEVHKRLGPGLLESAYRECLGYKLAKSGLLVKKEVLCPITFEEMVLPHGYRMDLLVEDKVVVELKVVDSIIDVHLAQILTHLKLGDFKLGLLINFNVGVLKYGIRRVVNGL